MRLIRRESGFWLALMAGVVAATALTLVPARGDDTAPTTRPAGSASRESRDAGAPLGFGAGRFRPGNPGTMRPGMNAEQPATAEDVREAEAFMQQTFPVRFHFYELLPNDRPAKKEMAL